jgi:hypothetical protein
MTMGDVIRPRLLHFGNNLSYEFVAVTISIQQQQQQQHGFGDIPLDNCGTYDEIADEFDDILIKCDIIMVGTVPSNKLFKSNELGEGGNPFVGEG